MVFCDLIVIVIWRIANRTDSKIKITRKIPVSPVKIVYNKMRYMIFQYGLEPVLIQWILIGFKAILEKEFLEILSYFQKTILYSIIKTFLNKNQKYV